MGISTLNLKLFLIKLNTNNKINITNKILLIAGEKGRNIICIIKKKFNKEELLNEIICIRLFLIFG